MRLSDLDYVLPEELIAQEPLEKRDASRLLVVGRNAGTIEHRKFFDILDYLRDDDLLILNDTRVIPARLVGHKASGGRVEVLLLKHLGPGVWQAMVKPGRRVSPGVGLVFDAGLSAEVGERTGEGGRKLTFFGGDDTDAQLARIGRVPLPPYIHRELADPERYQTVYSAAEGSAAAPTAGLHFTPQLLEKVRARGIRTVFITLHVGIATFRPVRTENIEEHEMHSEFVEVSTEAAEAINTAPGRLVCVGTTTARALESAAVGRRRVAPMAAETRLFIRPPYEFKIVEALVTNFHMPRSTLLLLVAAFAGADLLRQAYLEALNERYRFLSLGDAMFVY